MKKFNKTVYKSGNFDIDEAGKILRTQGKILYRVNLIREGYENPAHDGAYSGFVIKHGRTIWVLHMHNGEVYSIGYTNEEVSKFDAYPSHKILPFGDKTASGGKTQGEVEIISYCD
jgi:hypothetical protein